jgi:predicted permease
VLTQWAIPTVQMYGRLRPGVTAEAAKRASASALEALSRMHPQDIDPGAVLDTFSGDTRFMLPSERQRTWSIVRGAGLLTGVVLLVACLNISNLTLARAVSRVREMTIRTALGAGRWRVMRLVAMESILLGFAGAVGGGVLGAGVIAIVSAATGTSPVANVGLQWSVVLATSAAGLLAAVAIACAPAWKVGRQDLTLAARDGGERVSRGIGGARTRTWLVAGQVAGSCVLLVFAGQTLRGMERAFATQGFSVDRLAVAKAPLDAFDSSRARQIWLDDLRSRASAQADVETIAMVGTVPLGDTISTTSYAAAPRVPFQVFEIDSQFFSAVSIPVISGRAFTPQESNRSVIVSKRGALGMYGTLDVVGRGFPVSSNRLTIVGVAADAQFSRLQDQTLSVMYRPLAPDGAKALMIRTKSDPARLTSPLRQIARAADGRVVPDIHLLRDDFNRGIENLRLATTIASATAAVALVLASVGIFGVVAYGVAARSREIGIRLALGASAGALLRLLLRYTFWSLAIGMIAGLAAGWPVGKSFTQPPYYLQPLDLPASMAVGALFLAIGAIAAVVPAWRALTNDPMRGLRHE